MMITLRQICESFEVLDCAGDKDSVKEKLAIAVDALRDALGGMDSLHVAGRGNVDSLLGCMMATEAIIGENNNG